VKKETVYQCPKNPKHKQTVYVAVKEVTCGKCNTKPAPIMKALPPKEAQ
jgi:hypothetical protein